jgi:hypothetical protein
MRCVSEIMAMSTWFSINDICSLFIFFYSKSYGFWRPYHFTELCVLNFKKIGPIKNVLNFYPLRLNFENHFLNGCLRHNSYPYAKFQPNPSNGLINLCVDRSVNQLTVLYIQIIYKPRFKIYK